MITCYGKFAEIGGNVNPAGYISESEYDCKIFQALSVEVDKPEHFLGNHFIVYIFVSMVVKLVKK